LRKTRQVARFQRPSAGLSFMMSTESTDAYTLK